MVSSKNSQVLLRPTKSPLYRIAALGIDYLVIVGSLYLAELLVNWLLEIMNATEWWVSIVGIIAWCVIVFGYYTAGHMTTQTIGKRLMGIRLVDREGKPLPWIKLMARTSLFTLVVVLIGYSGLTNIATALGIFLTFIGGALFLSTLYTLFFNLHNQQTVYDLMVSSYVIDATYSLDDESLPLIKDNHKRIIVGLPVAGGLVSVIFMGIIYLIFVFLF